jgi:hypothetical protein
MKLISSKLYYRYDEVNKNNFQGYLMNNEFISSTSLLFLFKFKHQ